MAFRKVRFTNGDRHTAGLIFGTNWLAKASIGDISRPFAPDPIWAMGARRMECSPDYATWDEAFAHAFVETVA